MLERDAPVWPPPAEDVPIPEHGSHVEVSPGFTGDANDPGNQDQVKYEFSVEHPFSGFFQSGWSKKK